MPRSELAKVIGERLRKLRKKNKLSQEELAHLSQLHPTYIGQLERGEKNATIDTISKVAQALHISLDDLFRFSAPAKDHDETILELRQKLEKINEDDRKTLLEIISVMIEWKERTSN